MNIYPLIRPFLFSIEEEKAHKLTLSFLKLLPGFFLPAQKTNPVELMGLTFKHRIGLAAGFDKNAEYLDALNKLGFSFIEVGTVTPVAQSGNIKPRLFRLPKGKAIINRMGFNNLGVENLVNNIQKSRFNGILGINIGKNKQTPLQDAISDYIFCLHKVYPYASYVTINVSSPNTKDLRLLQQKKFFADLIRQIKLERDLLAEKYKNYLPLAIKISPDENSETLKNMIQVIMDNKIDAIIATNTTNDKKDVSLLEHGLEEGGLSGRPLLKKSNDVIRNIKSLVDDEITIIGTGGIDSVSSASEKIAAGASLLQLYTGLIYEGPALINNLVKRI